MLNILIVEDDQTVATVLKLSLESMGCSAENVYSCQGALDKVQESSYDLAFLDINLPDGDGVDLVGPLKEAIPDLQIVAMTGDCTRENETKAREQRIIYFLVKPFELAELRDLVEHVDKKIGLSAEGLPWLEFGLG